MSKQIETEKFLGIRYARANRFEKPIIVDYTENFFDEIFDGKKQDFSRYGACCPQNRTFYPENENSMYFREFRENLEFTYDEDCLFLNIFRPVLITTYDEFSTDASKKLPVLIYIHGGSFTRGSASERPFDGSNLSSRGIIVVTINYRLNIFGTYMGKNLMLYDMKAAIKWVYKYISYFGGNSENITLAGQSAGAMSVQALLLNEDISKIVKKSIMISGGGLLHGIYAPKNRIFAVSFYKSVEKDLKKRGLYALTATSQQLFESFHSVCKKRPVNATLMAVFPTFDECIVNKKNFSMKKASLILKENGIKTIFSVTKDDLSPRSYLAKNAKKLSSLCNKIGIESCYVEFNHYIPSDGAEKENIVDLRKGAWHSSDLWYFFGNLNQHTWRTFTAEDYEISEKMMCKVINFCKSF